MSLYHLPDPSPSEKEIFRLLGGADDAPLARWKVFPNGEFFVRVEKPDGPTIVFGRTKPPADGFLRTLLLTDTLRREGAKDITLVIPYLGYSRQDRQVLAGDSVASDALIRALAAAGASRIVTVDLHSERVAAASPIPIVNVSALPKLAAELKKEGLPKNVTVVSPDKGGLKRAERFAELLGDGAQTVWIEKKRLENGTVAVERVHGELSGQTAIVVDDILDTGGTVAQAVNLLKDRGYKDICLSVTHGGFSGIADVIINDLNLRKIFVTDTIDLPTAVQELPGLQLVGVADDVAAAVNDLTRSR